MPEPVTVQFGGELVIKRDELDPMILDQIKSALTFTNEDRAKQESLKNFGWWDLPEVIPYYKEETRRGAGDVICLPRGFAGQLFNGLNRMGVPFKLDDRRSESPAAEGYYEPFLLRGYQFEAAEAMMRSQQGVYKCPAGGGKTVTSLGMAAYLGQRALIVIDKANLLQQWRLRAAQFFDLPMEEDKDGKMVASLKGDRAVGMIGQDIWEERDLTICLRQTLWSRSWSMDATKWWDNWGLVIFDECHHLSSDTNRDVASKMTSKYLFGISATPAKSPTRGKIVYSTVGDIIHETTRELLYKEGVLMRPTIMPMTTDLEEVFWIDHSAKANEVCDVPDCDKIGTNHRHRNNYASVLKACVTNKKRNREIAEFICERPAGIHLVNSRQLKHLDLIKKAVEDAGWEGSIYMLRGKENAEGMFQEIAEQMEEDARAGRGALLLSTVAEEGMDIPPIDHTHVVFPMKDEGGLIQLIGRGERIFEGKTQSLVIDWRDPKTGCFAAQAAERDRVYRMLGHQYHGEREIQRAAA